MPSYSTGFCVAKTRNGSGSGCGSPSTVTWPSCIASSSAACVLGGVRLISSARTTPANTGPGRKTSSPARSAIVPVTSDGSMSGVNCSRRNSSASARAVALAGSSLRHAGDALQQHVTAQRERGQHVLQRLVVADDDLAYLARDAGVQLLHGRVSLSGLVRTSEDASASTYSTRGGGSDSSESSIGPKRRLAAHSTTSIVSANPISTHFTFVGEPAEPTRGAVAVDGLLERDRLARAADQRRARTSRCRPGRAHDCAAATSRRAARRCPRPTAP